MTQALDSLFDDIEQNPAPTQSRLVWVTELDDQENPTGYALSGDVIDHDGAVCGVGEYTARFDKAWATLQYYVTNFDNVSVEFKSKTFIF